MTDSFTRDPQSTISRITGFPSPAEPWRERALRLDDLLILHPATTYFVRAGDDSMRYLGIKARDLVLIDRSLELQDGVIILAILRGAFLLRRVRIRGTTLWLETDHPRYPAFAVQPHMQFELWGVALFVVRGVHPVLSLDACVQRYQAHSGQ